MTTLTPHKPLILIAEDEKDIALVARVRLEANGFEVITAPDGEQALAALRQRRPDLVLLDLKMPKLDGYQVCRILKNDPTTSPIPIILFSASSTHEVALRDKSLQLGANDCIRKPYSPEELISKIRQQLAAIPS